MQLNQNSDDLNSSENIDNLESKTNDNSAIKTSKNKTLKKLGFVLGLSIAGYGGYHTYQMNESIKESDANIAFYKSEQEKFNQRQLQRKIEEEKNQQEMKKEGLHKNGDYVIDFSKQIPEMNLYNNSLQIENSNIPFSFLGDNHIAFHANNYKNIDLKVSVTYIDSDGTYHIKDLSFNDIETLSQSYIISHNLNHIHTINTTWEGSIELDNEVILTDNYNTGDNEYFIEADYIDLYSGEKTNTGYIKGKVNANNKKIIDLEGTTPSRSQFIKLNIKLKDKFGNLYTPEGLDNNIFNIGEKQKTEE